MTGAALMPPAVRKEIHALLPIWGATTLAVAASPLIADAWIGSLPVVAYVIGILALGAHSIGHEYTHCTLGVLLSQPSKRSRTFAIKLAVLAAMLAGSCVIAWSALFQDPAMEAWLKPALLLFLPICCLFLAPLLTMLTRSTLAGAVLTVAVPCTMRIVAEILGGAVYGFATPQQRSFVIALWSRAIAGLCAVAPVLSWRAFMQLEAIEGPGTLVELRWFRTSGRVRARHPFWMLAKKELHLQQMVFVIGGLCLVGSTTLTLLKPVVPELRSFPVGPVTLVYLMLLPIVIGAVASAEERQFGTLECQMLLPMAAWQQWVIKVAMALGIALLLTMGAPYLLAQISVLRDTFRVPSQVWRQLLLSVVLLTTGSLYISSLCSSAVRALVIAVPAEIATVVFLRVMGSVVEWMAPASYTSPSAVLRGYLGPLVSPLAPTPDVVWLGIAAALVALLLWFALINHRAAEISLMRVARQVACIAALLTVGIVLLAVQ